MSLVLFIITIYFSFNHVSSSSSIDEEENEIDFSGISDAELCECLNIDIVCSIAQTETETCYYYRIDRSLTESYCLSVLNSITFGYGNLSECQLTPSDLTNVVTDVASSCYSAELSSDGVTVLMGEDGTPLSDDNADDDADDNDSTLSLFSTSMSDSSDDDDSSDGDDDDSIFSSTMASDTTATVISSGNFLLIGICFDSSIVNGVQTEGIIEINLDGNYAECHAKDIVPDFCGATSLDEQVITAEPTIAVEPESLSIVQIPTPNPITAQPTPAPTFVECNSNDALNVAFLLDESGSVNLTEWNVITGFVERIITFDISPSSFISLYEYATYPNFENFQGFTQNDAVGQATLIQALMDNRYNPSGLTATWDAVNRVLDDFWNYRFLCTDGCETRHDLLFLITDGNPTNERVCPDMIPRMSQSDVDIVLILIDPNGKINNSLVDCLDIRDNKMDVITLPKFNSDAFNAIENRIREKTCSGLLVETSPDRPQEGTEWRYPERNNSIGLGPIPTRAGNGGNGAGGSNDPGAFGMGQDIVDEDEYKPNAGKRNNVGNPWTYVLGVGSVLFFISLVAVSYLFIQKRNEYLDVMQQIETEVDNAKRNEPESVPNDSPKLLAEEGDVKQTIAAEQEVNV